MKMPLARAYSLRRNLLHLEERDVDRVVRLLEDAHLADQRDLEPLLERVVDGGLVIFDTVVGALPSKIKCKSACAGPRRGGVSASCACAIERSWVAACRPMRARDIKLARARVPIPGARTDERACTASGSTSRPDSLHTKQRRSRAASSCAAGRRRRRHQRRGRGRRCHRSENLSLAKDLGKMRASCMVMHGGARCDQRILRKI